MRKTLLLLALLLMMVGSPANAKAATNPQPVVHAALFWISGCPNCTQVLTNTLPPIKDKYKFQLSLLAIELVTTKDIDALYELGSSLGLAKEQVNVPFLLIDRTALIGVDEIRDRLSALIDQYISSGGVEYADLPILEAMIPMGIAYTNSEPYLQLATSTTTSSQALGIILAWAIMGIMGVALIVAILMIRRAFQGKPLVERKGWLDIAIPVLSLIGLGVSIYLTYVEVTHTRALCGPVGDCNAVQTSPYAKLFGFFPVGLLGAIGYVAILVAWFWRRLRTDALARVAGPAMYGMALFGTLFSIYLTYLELFVIHAVCIWCLSSAVIITVLMLLNLPPITQWLAISDEEE